MTEKLTDHERRCRELDRAFARYGMGRSEAEYFQSLLSCGEWLIGLWRASGPLALREGLEDLIGTKGEILAQIARLKNERHAARAGWRGQGARRRRGACGMSELAVHPGADGKQKFLVIASGAGAEVDAGLTAMIAEAFAIRNQLLSGSDASIEAVTERLGIAQGCLSSLVRLSYLAPDIVRALLAGRQPIELTPTRLLRLSKDLPHDWIEQRHFLGFACDHP